MSAFAGITSCIIVGPPRRSAATRHKVSAVMLALHAVLAVIIPVNLKLRRGAVRGGGGGLCGAAFQDDEPARAIHARASLSDAVLTAPSMRWRSALRPPVGLVIGVVTPPASAQGELHRELRQRRHRWRNFLYHLPARLAGQQANADAARRPVHDRLCRILMGCGIPTTANYIIMVTVAAAGVVQMGVEPIVAHFFVFLLWRTG